MRLGLRGGTPEVARLVPSRLPKLFNSPFDSLPARELRILRQMDYASILEEINAALRPQAGQQGRVASYMLGPV